MERAPRAQGRRNAEPVAVECGGGERCRSRPVGGAVHRHQERAARRGGGGGGRPVGATRHPASEGPRSRLGHLSRARRPPAGDRTSQLPLSRRCDAITAAS